MNISNSTLQTISQIAKRMRETMEAGDAVFNKSACWAWDVNDMPIGKQYVYTVTIVTPIGDPIKQLTIKVLHKADGAVTFTYEVCGEPVEAFLTIIN